MKRLMIFLRRLRNDRLAIVALLLVGLVLCGALVIPLNADNLNTTTFGSKYKLNGTPTRGESGWINLPYVGGLGRFVANDPKGLFKELKNCRTSLTNQGVSEKELPTIVWDGKDGLLAKTSVIFGAPKVVETNIDFESVQVLFQGQFYGLEFCPEMVRPCENTFGVFFPKKFLGGFVRISSPGMEDLYRVVEGQQMELSWGTLALLNECGIDQITFDIITMDGAHFLLTTGMSNGSEKMFIHVGEE